MLKQAVHLQDGGLDLDHLDACDAGHGREHVRRHPRPLADHERRSGTGARHNRGEADHDLRIHIAAVGRVHLPVHPQRAAALAFPDTHRGVRTFPESQLPHPAVLEEPLPRRLVHRLARVDRGAEVDEARAPTRRRRGCQQYDGPQRSPCQHPHPDPPVLR